MFAVKIEKSRKYKARKLRTIRESIDLSLNDLALACDISNAYLSKLETGKTNCTLEMKQRIESEVTKRLKKKVILRKKKA